MEEQVKPKPTSIKVIGVFLIFVAAYSLLSTAAGFMIMGGFKSAVLMFPLPFTIFLSITGVIYSVILLVSSIKFLKQIIWARTSLIILTWIYIIEMLLIAAYLILIRKSYFSEVIRNVGFEPSSTMLGILTAFYVIVTVVSVVVAGIILKYLYGNIIRNAMIH